MPMTALHRNRALGPKRSARPDKAARKRTLLACARHLFLTNGYHNTTTEQVAQAAAVSAAQLNRHFADKKMLFLEVLTEVRRQTRTQLQAELANQSDPSARLHAVAFCFLNAPRKFPLEFRFLHRTLSETDDEAILDCLREYFEELETLLAEVIREGQKAGVCRRSLDPHIGARELLHNFLGHTLTLPLDLSSGSPDDLPQAIDCLLHCVLKTDI
jgi:AcrR family transcriptional regulator